jgi:glycosyltransferase involved in cell wall biosynthesis
MRWSIKFSCQWASSVIAVSNNTKLDLMQLYNVDGKKIQVIYEGCASDKKQETCPVSHVPYLEKYLLFIGRLEERKNITGIISAFEILKEQYKIPHKLVLAGKSGFGYEKIKAAILNANRSKDIVELGFVGEQEKQELLKNADVFVFPTLYEGFGLPILEAQSAGTPVVASNNSSIKEIASGSALLVDPSSAEAIADAIHGLISDETFRNEIIKKGRVNVQRFSWEKCADYVAKVLIGE